MSTGKSQQITVTASSGLSKEEVERMVKDAESHASEDARKREEIEVRNATDALVYSTQHARAEQDAKLSADERAQVEKALDAARDALRGSDMDAMRQAQDALRRASQTLMQAASRPAGDSTASGSSAGQTGNGEVVDAEVVE
jgi:molecular chaperone DnaK